MSYCKTFYVFFYIALGANLFFLCMKYNGVVWTMNNVTLGKGPTKD